MKRFYFSIFHNDFLYTHQSLFFAFCEILLLFMFILPLFFFLFVGERLICFLNFFSNLSLSLLIILTSSIFRYFYVYEKFMGRDVKRSNYHIIICSSSFCFAVFFRFYACAVNFSVIDF